MVGLIRAFNSLQDFGIASRNLEIENPFVITESPSTLREIIEEMKTKRQVEQATAVRGSRATVNFGEVTVGR